MLPYFCGFSLARTEDLTKSRCSQEKKNFSFGLQFDQKGSGNLLYKKSAKMCHAIPHQTEGGEKRNYNYCYHSVSWPE